MEPAESMALSIEPAIAVTAAGGTCPLPAAWNNGSVAAVRARSACLIAVVAVSRTAVNTSGADAFGPIAAVARPAALAICSGRSSKTREMTALPCGVARTSPASCDNGPPPTLGASASCAISGTPTSCPACCRAAPCFHCPSVVNWAAGFTATAAGDRIMDAPEAARPGMRPAAICAATGRPASLAPSLMTPDAPANAARPASPAGEPSNADGT